MNKVLGIGLIWVCMLMCITTTAEARQLYGEEPVWVTNPPPSENRSVTYVSTELYREAVLGRGLLALADTLLEETGVDSALFVASDIQLGKYRTKIQLHKSYRNENYGRMGRSADRHDEVITFTIMVDSSRYYVGEFVFNYSKTVRTRNYKELLEEMGTPDSLIRKQLEEMRKPKWYFDTYTDKGELNIDAAFALLSDPSNQQIRFEQVVVLGGEVNLQTRYQGEEFMNSYSGSLQTSLDLFRPDTVPLRSPRMIREEERNAAFDELKIRFKDGEQ